MTRIVCGLAFLVMIVATTARAQAETTDPNSETFVKAIKAFENKDFQMVLWEKIFLSLRFGRYQKITLLKFCPVLLFQSNPFEYSF